MEYSLSDRLNIWLSIAFEGEARAARLVTEYNNGPEEFLDSVLKGTAAFPNAVNESRLKRIRDCASDSYIDQFITILEKDGVSAITIDDPRYPPLLREIDDPPFVLYARGSRIDSKIRNPIAVIGTRRCSDYGKTVASMMGRALADNGVTVVSGLAYGCDSHAHEGALSSENNEFPTVAVLGQGVLVEKTDYTAKTMDKILERGVVLSEFLPRSSPRKAFFPMRNRIISGISNGVLVVEAGKRSGTMITVDHALDQGRNVYAVPCRITEKLNCGTNEMLAAGMAHPVYSVEDMLLQLGITDLTLNKKAGNAASDILNTKQKMLYELITLGEKSFDTLLEKTGLSVEELNLHLTDLEFSGLIKQLPGRIYSAD